MNSCRDPTLLFALKSSNTYLYVCLPYLQLTTDALAEAHRAWPSRLWHMNNERYTATILIYNNFRTGKFWEVFHHGQGDRASHSVNQDTSFDKPTRGFMFGYLPR